MYTASCYHSRNEFVESVVLNIYFDGKTISVVGLYIKTDSADPAAHLKHTTCNDDGVNKVYYIAFYVVEDRPTYIYVWYLK